MILFHIFLLVSAIRLSLYFNSQFSYNFFPLALLILFSYFTYFFKKSKQEALAFYLCSYFIVGQMSIVSHYSIRSLLTLYFILLLIYFNKAPFKEFYKYIIALILFLGIGTLQLYLLNYDHPFISTYL